LSTLLRSEEILLLFFGEAKRQVFAAARQGDRRYPVSQLVRQKRIPVRVFWAPLPDEE
jgi:6-phosphogluconolactonase/glucosamine-6-phosphate isomerase/deaminase